VLPAEKKHYRKGLTLGLTLAETFSIVVFILLLACAVLLRFEQFQRDTAEAQRDTARVDLHITREMLNAENTSWGNADAWYEYARQLRDTVETLGERVAAAERERDRAVLRAAEADFAARGQRVGDEEVTGPRDWRPSAIRWRGRRRRASGGGRRRPRSRIRWRSALPRWNRWPSGWGRRWRGGVE